MTETRVFARTLYPRAAVENARHAFHNICEVQLEDAAEGTRAILTVPEDGTHELVGEFCNLALAAAIELHLAHAP